MAGVRAQPPVGVVEEVMCACWVVEVAWTLWLGAALVMSSQQGFVAKVCFCDKVRSSISRFHEGLAVVVGASSPLELREVVAEVSFLEFRPGVDSIIDRVDLGQSSSGTKTTNISRARQARWVHCGDNLSDIFVIAARKLNQSVGQAEADSVLAAQRHARKSEEGAEIARQPEVK